MSDHLIAEANRHAKALTDERNNLVVELNLLRKWQREVIQNEKAHHAEREDAIARAERAEAELATERARLDWLVKSSDNPLAINLFPSYGWTEVKKNLRASIDAAMKEEKTK